MTFADVKVGGKVTVQNGAVSLQKNKYNITNYNGDITFTEKGLESNFTANVNTVKTTGHWKESFEKSTPISTDIVAKGIVTEQSLLKFGINITDYWKGSADTDFKLQLSSGRISHISATADATKSAFMIPYSTYINQEGSKKTITLSGKENRRGLVLDNITIKSLDTNLVLTDLTAKNGLRSFDITSLNAGTIVENATGQYRHTEGQRPTLALSAEKLDAEQFINYDPVRPAPSAKPLGWTNIKAKILLKQCISIQRKPSKTSV